MAIESNNVDWTNVDAICCVATQNRTKECILSVLNNYLNNRESLNVDDYDLQTDGAIIQNETEMIDWLACNSTAEQLLFWNEADEKGDMVGANFTSDGMIVFSLTTMADGKREFEMMENVKKHIDSQYGMINYNAYPGFDDGAGFIDLCGNTEQSNSSGSR